MEDKKKVLVKIKDLVTREPFSGLFAVEEATLAAIKAHMKQFDYDPTQPVALWRDGDKKLVVLDGHCRLAVARELKHLEIPAVELMNIENEDEALEYAYHSQRDRRNLDDAGFIKSRKMFDKHLCSHGGDRKTDKRQNLDVSNEKSSAKATAKKMGVSASKVDQARALEKEPEIEKEVLARKKTLHAGAAESRKKRKQEKAEAAPAQNPRGPEMKSAARNGVTDDDIEGEPSIKDVLVAVLRDVSHDLESILLDCDAFTETHGEIDGSIFRQFTEEELDEVRQLMKYFALVEKKMVIIKQLTSGKKDKREGFFSRMV